MDMLNSSALLKYTSSQQIVKAPAGYLMILYVVDIFMSTARHNAFQTAGAIPKEQALMKLRELSKVVYKSAVVRRMS